MEGGTQGRRIRGEQISTSLSLPHTGILKLMGSVLIGGHGEPVSVRGFTSWISYVTRYVDPERNTDTHEDDEDAHNDSRKDSSDGMTFS
ncbi:hypothetical protein EYF80_033772 [Liparis tanakae]|uniref:Uncharacterized protein n=1 Tax=Liparis tanakae TaxID=230148 RepID=A0A4Z2GRF2_9TELE|nr:hypothetical protein EYF80_033772 [Liparis tanakae]